MSLWATWRCGYEAFAVPTKEFQIFEKSKSIIRKRIIDILVRFEGISIIGKTDLSRFETFETLAETTRG